MCVPQLTTFAKDALFVTVGFGVLGFQKAQVRRREATEALTGMVGVTLGGLDDVVKAVEQMVTATQRQLRQLAGVRAV